MAKKEKNGRRKKKEKKREKGKEKKRKKKEKKKGQNTPNISSNNDSHQKLTVTFNGVAIGNKVVIKKVGPHQSHGISESMASVYYIHQAKLVDMRLHLRLQNKIGSSNGDLALSGSRGKFVPETKYRTLQKLLKICETPLSSPSLSLTETLLSLAVLPPRPSSNCLYTLLYLYIMASPSTLVDPAHPMLEVAIVASNDKSLSLN
ncbi:hypothetical protein LguiA_017740 [Lonicera macranthoides]